MDVRLRALVSGLGMVALLAAATLVLAACDGGDDEAPAGAPATAVTGVQTPPPSAGTPAEAGDTPAATPGEPVDANVMVIDAVPGGAVDASVSVAAGSTFQVDLVLSESPSAYQAFQYKVRWDASVVDFVEQEYGTVGPLTFCAPGTKGEDDFYGGCAGREPTNFTGVAASLTFRCVGGGTSPLHLITPAEDEPFGSSIYAGPGVPVPTELGDAEVTCQ